MEESASRRPSWPASMGHESAKHDAAELRDKGMVWRLVARRRVTAMLLMGRDSRLAIRRNIVPQSFRRKKNAALRRRIP
jgi:hypothetical protein